MASTDPVLAQESEVAHGLHGRYDIRLIRTGERSLLIEVVLTLFFDFVANEDDDEIVWTEAEEAAFVSEWRRQIPGAWDRADQDSHNGHSLSIRFDCDIRTSPAGTLWQARVFKMKTSGDVRVSAVARNFYARRFDAEFDSNDHRTKPGGDGTQTTMIHEFGHMIGNPDEYKRSSPHYSDTNSVMHNGSTVRSRHLQHLIDWAKPHIDDLRDGGMRMMETKARPMSFLRSLPLVESVDAEVALVEAWRDALAPDSGARFTVRRRDTLEPVPIDRIVLEDYAALEILFRQSGAAAGDEIVWQPRSAEALQAIFIE